MKTEDFESKLRRIQDIVPWQEEERVGYYECRSLGKLPTIILSDIDNKSKELPKDVDVFVVGGLADRGTTRHDIDVFILNKTDKSKDEIDLKVKQTFLNEKGRMFRVYNLDKFEKDMNHLKNIIEQFNRSDRQQRTNLCEKINPILEIHSHCKPEDKEEEFGTEGECKAKNIENIPDFNVYKCTGQQNAISRQQNAVNRGGCKLVKKNRAYII